MTVYVVIQHHPESSSDLVYSSTEKRDCEEYLQRTQYETSDPSATQEIVELEVSLLCPRCNEIL